MCVYVCMYYKIVYLTHYGFCGLILNLLFESFFFFLDFFYRIWDLSFENYNNTSNSVVCNHLLNKITSIFLLALTKWSQLNKVTKTNSIHMGWVFGWRFLKQKKLDRVEKYLKPNPTNQCSPLCLYLEFGYKTLLMKFLKMLCSLWTSFWPLKISSYIILHFL